MASYLTIAQERANRHSKKVSKEVGALSGMGGKAKFKKHTAADLERRQKQVNKGGGKTGAATRAVAKLNFTCDICMVRL